MVVPPGYSIGSLSCRFRLNGLTSEIAQFTAQDRIFERHRFVVAGQGRVES